MIAIRPLSLRCLVILIASIATAQQERKLTPCSVVAAKLTLMIIAGKDVEAMPRVEVRRCFPSSDGNLQIVAFKANDNQPSLVFDTSDFFIQQIVSRDNVALIETGGGMRDQVFVIVFKRGVPAIELQQVTKGTAQVSIDSKTMNINISGIYAGDLPDRSINRMFLLKPGDLWEGGRP